MLNETSATVAQWRSSLTKTITVPLTAENQSLHNSFDDKLVLICLTR